MKDFKMTLNCKKTNYFFPFLALFAASVIVAEEVPMKVTIAINQAEQPSQQSVQDIDLQIVNPIFMINKRDPDDSFSFDGKTITRYQTKIVLCVWNRGEQKCYFPTKVSGVSSWVDEKEETLQIKLEFASTEVFLVETADRPKIPIVQAESSFEIAEIQPGEAAGINYEMKIHAKDLSKAKQVVFTIKSGHKGRYSFWEGELKSESFPLDSTPNFRVVE
jgi:hypothetical protein